MNPIRLLLICSTFFSAHVFLSGQPVNQEAGDVIMPAPNVAAFAKFVDIPVSRYTGIPDITIPIHTLEEGPIQVPVALRYHASGVRIGEPASWVGAGWNLSAGGSVSRTVLGLRDEGPNGYLQVGAFLDPESQQDLYDIGNGIKDGEPDIFAFQCGPYHGKFYIDADSSVILVPEQELDITFQWKSTAQYDRLQSFRIVTPEGMRYHFGLSPVTGEQAIESYQTANSTRTATAWHLMLIESFDQNFQVHFSYAEDIYSHAYLPSCTLIDGQINCPYPAFVKTFARHVSAITTTTERMDFFSQTPREDLQAFLGSGVGKRLDSVQVTSGAFCKSFRLFHDYFEDNSNYKQHSPVDLRLKLDSIRESSCDASEILPPYRFSYKGTILDGRVFVPNRLSKAIDHWGYYNGALSNNDILDELNIPETEATYDLFGVPQTITYGSANRDSDPASMQAGVLERVEYPTGGSVHYSYEANTYYGQVTDEVAFGECRDCGEFPVYTAPVLFNANLLPLVTYSATATPSQTGCIPPQPGDICYDNPQALVVYLTLGTSGQRIDSVSFGVTQQPDTYTGLLTELFPAIEPGVIYRFELRACDASGCFQYEIPVIQNENIPVGGLRIREITIHDGLSTGNDIKRTFEYDDPNISGQSSGVLFQMPTYWTALTPGTPGALTAFGVVWYDYSIVPLHAFEGHHIAYRHVREYRSGAGSTDYTFFVETNNNSSSSIPYPPQSARILSGELNSSSLNSDTAVGVSWSLIQPEDDPYSYNTYPIIKVFASFWFTDTIQFDVTYQNRTRPYRILSETTAQDGVVITRSNTYDPQHRFLMQTGASMLNSNGDTCQTRQAYIHDYDPGLPGDSLIRSTLIDQNRILQPFQVEASVNSETLDGQRDVFAWFDRTTGLPGPDTSNAVVRLFRTSRFERTWDAEDQLLPGNWKDQTTIDQVDSSGNPIQLTEEGWEPLYLTWDHDVLSEKRFGDFTWKYTYFPGTKLLKTFVDIDSQDTHYAYDPLGRLVEIRERDDHVITEYRYQYTMYGQPINALGRTTTYDSVPGSALGQIEYYQYYDGLGREIQEVRKGYSQSMMDVVVTTAYDTAGRISRVYEPFESGNHNGDFVQTPETTPFTAYAYEASPISRVTTTTPPAWYPTKMDFGTNAAHEVQDIMSGGFWPPGSLFKVTQTGPGGRQHVTYSDKKGRQVLSSNRRGADQADTYFMFDQKDRLTRIVPPGSVQGDTSLGFHFRYDGRDNIIYKNIPGAGPQTFSYNPRDLLEHTSNPVLEAEGLQLQHAYDSYGRLTHLYQVSADTAQAPPSPNDQAQLLMAYDYDGFDGSTNSGLPQDMGRVKTARINILNGHLPGPAFLEHTYTYDPYGRISQVSRNTISNLEAGSHVSEMTYDWLDNILLKQETFLFPEETIQLGRKSRYDHSGRLTDKWLKINNAPEKHLTSLSYTMKDEVAEKNIGRFGPGDWSWLQSIDFKYHPDGRLQKINSADLPGGHQLTFCPDPPADDILDSLDASSDPDLRDLWGMEIRYDSVTFMPNPEPERNGNISQLTWQVRGRQPYTYRFAYDFLDRITNAWFASGQPPSITHTFDASFSYDLRGNFTEVKRKGLYWTGSCYDTSRIDDLQYLYAPGSNTLNQVIDQAPCPQEIKLTEPIRQNMTIAASERIILANMLDRGANIQLLANDEIRITPQFRFGGKVPGGTLYTGEGPCPPYGSFTGGFLQTSVEGLYQHDAAGNLSYDPNRRMTFEHNYLNLPFSVTGCVNNQCAIEWLYDASGQKHRKTVLHGGDTLYYRDYLPGIEYIRDSLLVISHDAGRVVREKDSLWRYEYAIRDHLGHLRLSFADKNANGIIEFSQDSTNEVLEEGHYYPFGLQFSGPWQRADENAYLYQGKEWNKDFNLKLFDFGARWYDPATGRFNGVDALAVDRHWSTPYHFVQNNPILRIDEYGLIDSAYLVNLSSGTIKNTGPEGGDAYDVITYVNDIPVPQKGAILGREIVYSGGSRRLGPGQFAGPLPVQASGALEFSFNPIEFPIGLSLSPAKAIGLGLMALLKGTVRSQLDELPEFVFHYTSKEAAELISRSQLGRSTDDILYLTTDGGMTPLQAQLNLALPRSNTAEAVFSIRSSALHRNKIEMIRNVAGNVFNRPGGGTEILYRGTVNLSNLTRVK